MAVLTGKARAALPDSAFAFVEPDSPEADGKTEDKYRHYPVHDAIHVRAALSQIGQGSRYGKEAKAKVMAAAKEHGVDSESSETGRSLESLEAEVRFINTPPEFRSADAAGGGGDHIFGYAAVYGHISRKLGGFFEVIDTRAFAQDVDGGFEGVVCRYNHDPSMMLGTTKARTLGITTDERGMLYDVLPPRARADVVELVQRGDVGYSSFAFRCLEPGVDDSWGVSSMNQPLRTLHNVKVVDVAPVNDPAYFATSAAARSMSGAVESLARWVDAPVDEVRSYMQAGQALKFLKRSDRPSPPKAEVPSLAPADAGDRAEIRMVDDECVALRNWRIEADTEPVAPVAPAPEVPAATEERTAPAEAELRAAMKGFDDLCRRWTEGEPCVRPQGHEDDCKQVCWARHNSGGLPCNQPNGHEGEHTPMPIMNSRDAGDEGVETRDAGDEVTPEVTPEAPQEEEIPAERMFDPIKADAEFAAAQLQALEFERLLNA